MSWYKVTLSSAEVVNGRHMQLQNAFTPLFMAAGGPKDAGMFSTMDMRNDYYFSPGAVRLARSIILGYGGVECQAPKRSELAMLVVNSGAESIPFAAES